MGHTIRTMTDDEIDSMLAEEGLAEDIAVHQSHDRELMLTELSEYDLDNMDEIVRDGHGDWFHAKLIRALYELLLDADSNNKAKLRSVFPGTCAAVMAWYNKEIPKAD